MLRIVNLAERAEVYLYGTIGEDFWGESKTAQAFADEINALAPKPLDIHIDSGGGDVFQGFAMVSIIQRYPGETHAYVDGLAASAASYVAVACDTVTMNDYAWMMIHQTSAYAYGNADQLTGMVDRLRMMDQTLVNIYAKRTALDEDAIAEAMKAETWYSAADALAVNLCQEVIETEERMAAYIDPAIAAHYQNTPETIVRLSGYEPLIFSADDGDRFITSGEIVGAEDSIDLNAGGFAGADEPAAEEGGKSHDDITLNDRASYIAVGGNVYRKDQQ